MAVETPTRVRDLFRQGANCRVLPIRPPLDACHIMRDKVVDAGPIQISVEKKKNIPIPPLVGAVALVGGIGLLAMDRKKA